MAATHERAGLARKRAVVEGIHERAVRSQAVFVTDFRGLSVAAMTRLRRRVRDAEGEYLVAKNTLIRRGIDKMPDGFDRLLGGPSGLCFAYKDAVAMAKLLSEFARESRVLGVKGGLLQGRVLAGQDVETLAQLPGREVLLARVLGTMKAPVGALAIVLSGVVRKMVVVLEEIRKQKEAGQAQAAS